MTTTTTASEARGLLSFFTDRKITTKIAIVVGVGLCGLVLVGATYLVGANLQSAEQRIAECGGPRHIPVIEDRTQRSPVDGGHIAMKQPRPIQLPQNRHHPAGAVHILHMEAVRCRCDLAQVRHAPR